MPGFIEMVQYFGEGDVEFAGTGVAWYFVIMPFDDVCECGDAEVIGFGAQFSVTQHRYVVAGFLTKFIEPGLCVGKGEDEFDEMGFVEHAGIVMG